MFQSRGSSNSLLADDLMVILAEHYRDFSLAVRKQMVISLSELVKTYSDKVQLVSFNLPTNPSLRTTCRL